MARVAAKLTPKKNGGYSARKRIPEDVRKDYAERYDKRWEERFSCGDSPNTLARAKYREWLSEIEARIANIRAERTGAGQTLTPQQARALAGEWYHWFTAIHLGRPHSLVYWEERLSEISNDVYVAIAETFGRTDGEIDTDEAWKRSPEVRERVRPMLADWGETSQFLASKALTLDSASRELFLDYLYSDFAAALKLFIRRADGDYSEDLYPSKFPKFAKTADPSLTPWSLFKRWNEEVKPAPATVDRWRGVFLHLGKTFGECSAAAITEEQARDWARKLVSKERSAGTVQDVWINACRTVFGWAVDHKMLTHNPFRAVKVSVPRKTTSRPNKAFTDEEVNVILSAALAVTDLHRKSAAAKRWVPWLCAYTGARAGEMTQLRGSDVFKQDGVPALKITPAAGTVKQKSARTVPLHDDLVAQGFLKFVKASGKGPLFYKEAEQARATIDATNPPKARYVKAREHLAAWVRELGVKDTEIRPIHAWRHTFKQKAARAGVSERVSDAITGHAPAYVGRSYGAPTLADMAEELKKFPRYQLPGKGRPQQRSKSNG